MKYQKTIAAEVVIAGQALHKGIPVTMRLLPQPANTGIYFKRIDLPGQPAIKADADAVIDTKRCVTIGNKQWRISTIEHLMAVLQGLEIDNVLVEVDGEELPLGDGCGYFFTEQILNAGLVEQDCLRHYRSLSEALWVKGLVYKDNEPSEAIIVALPSERFEISYTFTSDHQTTGTQFYHFVFSPENFRQEIVSARTIAFVSEIEALRRQGLAQSQDVDSVVVVGEHGYENELRYPEEIVRHKILDILGDLYLLGPMKAHIIAVRSGHALDLELARKVVAQAKIKPVVSI